MPFSPFWVRVPFSQFTFPLLFTSRVSKKFQNNFAVKKRCVCVVGGGGGGGGRKMSNYHREIRYKGTYSI